MNGDSDVGDLKLVTIMMVNKMAKPSSTSESCRQHISSLTFVTNIKVTKVNFSYGGGPPMVAPIVHENNIEIKNNTFIMFDVFMLNEKYGEPKQKLTKTQMNMHSTKIYPCLPYSSANYKIDRYHHNGYLFHLESNRKYIIMATCASSPKSTDECKFMIRAIGPKLELKHLD